MLDWYSNPELRRRTGLGLNKGEARNTLARAIFFNRLGEQRDRSFENQAYRASGLNLIVAAIVLWNTRYLAPVFTELARLGHDTSSEMIRHVAPSDGSTSPSPAITRGISPKPPRPKRSGHCAPAPQCSQPEFALRSHERDIKCTFVT